MTRVVVLFAFVASPLLAQPPSISGAEEECIPRVEYPLIDSTITPGDAIHTTRCYFRAVQGPHFYYVEGTGAGDAFECILPVPAPDTAEVVYYVEAIAKSADAGRTEEYTTPVVEEEDDCDERIFAGTDPDITVFSTAEGASSIPTGFLSGGITSTVTAGGVTTAVGGGLGPGVITGIVVGGAIGGAVLVDELDDPSVEETPTSPSTP